ncbi:MAG TPA: ATP-binding cassette domain-containing protein, partial [Planctomycetota bacterium]|nr:ATP-binding cassette domain-containing protein [Planctomycetota bacterium]
MTSVAQPPATTAPAFTLAGLSLARPHGGFRLGPIDLRFPTDASVALVGPSGSGKTTLLRLIAGLERPDAGEITWAGERWSEGGRIAVPAAARRIGFVFQDGALWPHLDAIAHVR